MMEDLEDLSRLIGGKFLPLAMHCNALTVSSRRLSPSGSVYRKDGCRLFGNLQTQSRSRLSGKDGCVLEGFDHFLAGRVMKLQISAFAER